MNFCRKHSSYQKAATVQAEVAAWTAELLPRIPQLQGQVMEVGAGTGLFTQYLSKHFPELIATDLSQAMIEVGKTSLPDVSWKVQDAWELPANEKISGLFSSSLLQWSNNPKEVLSKWNQVLAPGAWMLHSFFIEGSLNELQSVAPESIALNFRSIDDWKQYFQDSGFQVLDTAQREDLLYFDSALRFFRNLHDLGATSPNKFSPSQLRRILEKYESEFSSDQGVSTTWCTGRFLCRKPLD